MSENDETRRSDSALKALAEQHDRDIPKVISPLRIH